VGQEIVEEEVVDGVDESTENHSAKTSCNSHQHSQKVHVGPLVII
jgi:hypothetical protein